jgi:transposase
MSDGVWSPTPVCLQDVQLLQRIAELEALVHNLQERVNRNSSNSLIPHSANLLDAPKPAAKIPKGCKPGGQRGHHRHRIPLKRVKDVVPCVPITCARCQTPLPVEAGPNEPDPTWHQVAEIPELAAEITEHQGHTCTCPRCGHLNRGEIPLQIRTHVIGRRLAAMMSYFSGRHHLS